MSNLLIGVFAWWFAEGTGLMQQLSYKLGRKRIKPFDCGLCLGFWLGLSIGYYQTYDILSAIQLGFVSSVIAILTEKIMNRL